MKSLIRLALTLLVCLVFLNVAGAQDKPRSAFDILNDAAKSATPVVAEKSQSEEYEDAYQRATRECKPLIVFVGASLTPINGAVVVRYDAFRFANETFPSPTVVVSANINGELWHTRSLPGNAGAAEIGGWCNAAKLFRQTPPPPAASTWQGYQPTAAYYQGLFGGNSKCGPGGCPNGQCGQASRFSFRR